MEFINKTSSFDNCLDLLEYLHTMKA